MSKPNYRTVKITGKQQFWTDRINKVKDRLPKPLRPWYKVVEHTFDPYTLQSRVYNVLYKKYQDAEVIDYLERIAAASEALINLDKTDLIKRQKISMPEPEIETVE